MGERNRMYADIVSLQKEVTGSCIPITIKFNDETTKHLLIDCGMFQEEKYNKYNTEFPFDVNLIEHVIITHNHVDHIGRLPLLVKNGFKGKIHMSITTLKLISRALEDNFKIAKAKAELTYEPCLYSEEDVKNTLNFIVPHNFEETIRLDNNTKVTFFMNGHLPGAIVGLLQTKYKSDKYNSEMINILFTGDYNNKNMFFKVKPIPKWVYKLPLTIIQEATYGKMSSSEIKPVFEENILNAIALKKQILIPVFSLGRSQEILYLLRKYQDEGKLSKNIPIYYDGNLGIQYTNIYLNDGLDNDVDKRDFLPYNIKFIENKKMRINLMNEDSCKIILTTSGMGNNGPAQIYIPFYLKKKNALIQFTGYVAENTLGRILFECKLGDLVNFSGLEIIKRADVQFTTEFSAHAKNDELINFLKPFEDIKLLLINHGEESTLKEYCRIVYNELDLQKVGILGPNYCFRINPYGFDKSFPINLYKD